MLDIEKAMWNTYHKFVKFTKVPAIIDNKEIMLDELQIRSLQVVCANYCKNASDSVEACKEFNNRVKIYCSPNKEYTMTFRTDGKFEECFKHGFTDASYNLAYEIL